MACCQPVAGGIPLLRALLALTHRSLANEHGAGQQETGKRTPKDQIPLSANPSNETTGDNERLEFLGDAVLGLVVAESLFLLHPEWHEGELTRVRAQLVSRNHIAEVAEAIGLGSHLRLSRGEDKAACGATPRCSPIPWRLCLGRFFSTAACKRSRGFVRRWVMGETAEQLAKELRSGAALGNYKSALQEHLQAARAGAPVYRVKSESGPDHRKRFLVEVRLKTAEGEAGKRLARGMGSTKKNADRMPRGGRWSG